jgi:hypothetical protein
MVERKDKTRNRSQSSPGKARKKKNGRIKERKKRRWRYWSRLYH